MIKRLTILFSLALLSSMPLQAQYYQTGSDPSGLRWRQIKGEHFDVIYPGEVDSLAREFLYSFEKTRRADITGLNIETEHLPLILHPYNLYSNGTVVWAPKRTEIWTTPPADALYPLNWEMQLATHEGRHIGQMAHYTKGIYRILMLLTGEQGIAVGVGLYPSKTLLEGDAVQNETDLTGAGRGRNPEFLKFYRAMFLDADTLSYDGWRYGSYHRYTPDKYAFGYMISSAMRYNSGNYFVTGDIMQEQVKSWWRIFSVSHRSYNKASGLTTRKNWRKAIALNTEQWQKEYEMHKPYSPFTPLLAEREKYYTEFGNTLPLSDEVYATMSGLQYERRLVSIDSLGKVHRKRPFAAATSALRADSDHSFIFSEIVPDPRWEHRSWSVIRRYDSSSGKIETLTHKSRYFNPAAAGKDTILAAEYKVAGGSDVVILDRDGKLTGRIEGPEHGQILNAVKLGDTIYSSAITSEGAGLFRYDGNSWERVIAPQKRAIRSLQASGDSLLYFVSDLNGVSNIYGYRPENDELRQIASSPFSAANPYMDEEGSLWYSDYDKHGYQPVKLASKDFENREASFSRPFLNPITEHNARQAEKYVVPLSAREDSLLRKSVDSLESRPYSKVLHGIHIHSWFPLYVNPNRIMNDIGRFNLDNWYEFASLGATLISQNELGTVSAMAAYSYRSDKWRQYHGAHLNVNYSGLYPVFEISADFNDRPRNISTVTLIDERIGKLRYEHGNNALTASALVYVPINLSRGGWYTGLTPQFRYIFSNDKLTYIYKNQSFSSNGIHSLRAGFSWYSQLAQAKARLKPRLGFGVSAIVQTDVEMIPFSHRLEAVNAYAYLPGVAKEDNFKLTYNFQHQGGLVTNERLVKLPRGYSTDPLLRNYHGFSLDYAFPVNFNGLDGGWFFYLKRLELIPFADYGYDFGNKDNKFGSAGISMLVRTYLFRIGTELHFGVQYAHTLEGTDSFKFILSSGF